MRMNAEAVLTCTVCVSGAGMPARQSLIDRFKNLELETQIMLVLLCVTFVRGVLYATIVPAWQMADESSYYLNIQAFAAQALGFPAAEPQVTVGRTPAFVGLYLMPYAATAAIGGYIQLLALRLVSVLLTVATVYGVYRVARLFVPEDRLIVLGAPLFVAFLPQFTHVMASITPDAPAICAATFFFVFALRLLRHGSSVKDVTGLVVTAVFAALSKQTAFFLVPLAIMLPAFVLLRTSPHGADATGRRNKLLAVWGACSLLAVPAIAWVATRLTEATVSLEFVLNVLTAKFLFAALRPALDPTNMLFRSFWGYFGWLSIGLDPSYYQVLLTLSLLAAAGVVVYFARSLCERHSIDRQQLVTVLFFIVTVLVAVAIVLVRQRANPAMGYLQGRWVYPALAPIAVLLMLGWRQAFARTSDNALLLSIAGAMFVLDATALYGHISRTYYSAFPGQVKSPMIVFGPGLADVTILQKIVAARPILLQQGTFYLAVALAYVIASAEWCRLLLARPAGTSDSAVDARPFDQETSD